jgi:hypothetical protein
LLPLIVTRKRTGVPAGMSWAWTSWPWTVDRLTHEEYSPVMVMLNESHALSDFQHDAKKHLRRLTKTGQPELLTLTVNGKPAMVVQDARSYQRLLDTVEMAEAIAGIKLALESMARGKGQPASAVFARRRRKHRIPADPNFPFANDVVRA